MVDSTSCEFKTRLNMVVVFFFLFSFLDSLFSFFLIVFLYLPPYNILTRFHLKNKKNVAAKNLEFIMKMVII